MKINVAVPQSRSFVIVFLCFNFIFELLSKKVFSGNALQFESASRFNVINAIIADHLRKNRVCRIDLKGDSRVVDVINSNKNVYLDSAAERDQIGITLIILDREQ